MNKDDTRPVITVAESGHTKSREKFEMECERLFVRGYHIGSIACTTDQDGNEIWQAVFVWPSAVSHEVRHV